VSDRPPDDVAGRPKGPLDAAAWDGRWASGNTPWDMGEPSPPLVAAVEAGMLTPPGRVLVPGVGAGHDARFLAGRGFDVTGIDLSNTAIGRARALAAEDDLDLTLEIADLLALPPSFHGSFDAVFEHTCFCAIDPILRGDYVNAVADVLRPGGTLLGVFFVFTTEEGPPFGASEEELRERFGPRFEIDVARWAENSAERRQGIEMLFRMTRRA
jgi:SAM-dependent methyltransferase